MKFLAIETVTPPASGVVTVQEFTDHARLNGITVGNQPTLIQREIDAATARAEKYLRRSLLTQTLKALYVPDGLDCRCTLTLILPRGPVDSVTSVTSQGDVIDPATYTLSWNTVILDAPLPGAAEVVFVSAGYGTDPANVPASIKEGILEYATTLYEDRDGAREPKYRAAVGQIIPWGVQDLWRPYQIEVSG